MAATERAAGHTQLTLYSDPLADRVTALKKERERLLRQIATKKTEIERAAEALRRAMTDTLAKIGPLLQRHDAVRAEIRALFDELCSSERLSKRARKEVEKVRRILQEEGVLEDLTDDGEAARGDDEDAGDGMFDGEGSGSDTVADREVRSAEPRGQGKGQESLRSLFRRLALAVHPDRAEHAPERERRTELMKELTRAYEDGDLARLLAFEEAWATDAGSASSSDPEQRCQRLEQMNRELRAQLRALNRDLRELRRSPSAAFEAPIELIMAAAEAEIEDLERTRDFIRDFRDGKISLRRFVEGPQPLDEEDIAELERGLDAMVDAFARDLDLSPRGPSIPGRRKKRRTR